MPTKISPIFHQLSLHLLRLSLLVHKLRKPLIPKLLKKFRKRKEFKLLRHYDYGEYQFSTSSTPLIGRNRGLRGLCSFFYVYWCLGNLKVEGSRECQVEPLPVSLSLSLSPFPTEDAHDLFENCHSFHEGESVDQKAERFIQSFYHQIRMQRQESL